MVHIALVENSCEGKANYLEGCRVPRFYMEDYTVLGFPVTGFERVKELLKKAGYTLLDGNGGSKIVLQDHQQVYALYEFFQRNKIETVLTDIADTLYQA